MSLLAFMYSEPYFWNSDIFESSTSRRNKKKKAERDAKGIIKTKPTFSWGVAGQSPPADLTKWWNSFSSEAERRAAPYKNGYGVSHIIAKRDWEGQHIKALLGQKGKDFVMSLIEVIAKGKKRTERTRIILEFVPKHIKVVLEKSSEANIAEGKSAENWLISSYEILTSGNYQLIEDSGR